MIELSEYKEYGECRGVIPMGTRYHNLEAESVETCECDLGVYGKDGDLTLRDCTRIQINIM